MSLWWARGALSVIISYHDHQFHENHLLNLDFLGGGDDEDAEDGIDEDDNDEGHEDGDVVD